MEGDKTINWIACSKNPHMRHNETCPVHHLKDSTLPKGKRKDWLTKTKPEF